MKEYSAFFTAAVKNCDDKGLASENVKTNISYDSREYALVHVYGCLRLKTPYSSSDLSYVYNMAKNFLSKNR
jgi:hypothetical protein